MTDLVCTTCGNAFPCACPSPEDPPSPPPRWIWVYGYTPVPDAYPLKMYETSSEPNIVDRLDEVHLFPDETIPPEKRVVTTFLLERKHVPLCKRELYAIRPRWRLFNTGAGDPRRLATIAGNATIICADCEAIAIDLKKGTTDATT